MSVAVGEMRVVFEETDMMGRCFIGDSPGWAEVRVQGEDTGQSGPGGV